MTRSISRIIISHLVGFIIFLILLAIANFIIDSVNLQFYTEIVRFIDSNIVLLFILTFVGLINEIFWNFSFPFTLLAPPVAAILSVYVITFIYKLWLFLETYINTGINIPIASIFIVVFVIVIFVGYIVVFSRIGKKKEEFKIVESEEEEEELNKKTRKKVEWADVGEEFKQALYGIGRRLNNSINKKKK